MVLSLSLVEDIISRLCFIAFEKKAESTCYWHYGMAVIDDYSDQYSIWR